MNYSVLIHPRAQRELSALPNEVYEKIKFEIAKLAANPRPQGCRKLRRREGWRIRVGVYRVIYEIDDPGKLVTVLQIGHRRDIYR